MKILTIPKIRELDQYTIDNEPISSQQLMERAANKCSKWITKNIHKSKSIAVICGGGNNGGDGLAIARLLKQNGYSVNCFLATFSNQQSEDNKTQEAITSKELQIIKLHSYEDFKLISSDIIVDALFGSGINRMLEGSWKLLIDNINKSSKYVISIDVPSGLYMDRHCPTENPIIRASVCLNLVIPKKAMFIPDCEKYFGTIHNINIGLSKEGIKKAHTKDYLIQKKDIKPLLKKRPKFSHKGTYGQALLVCGSKGMIGASILMAKSCLRSGVGTAIVHAPKCAYQILQCSTPEAMVHCDELETHISNIKMKSGQTLGLGPGIGTHPETALAITKLITEAETPLLIDADALNIIAEKPESILQIPKNSILTPHPKEAKRILGDCSNSWELHDKSRQFAIDHKVYFVLKGAHTQIHCPDGTCYFNSTGNPGMATGGSGDVLSGIITSLLAQKYSSKEAAIIGVFIHGLSGDIMAEKVGEISLNASDLILGIPKAFKSLTN
jgi:NAD(P)H-hydrate epimerase